MSGRTAKDGGKYNAELRREEPIKTEVIVEHRAANKALQQAVVTLLTALIQAQDALRVYRIQALANAQQALAHDGHCVPGCARHVWRDKDGWHRTDESS